MMDMVPLQDPPHWKRRCLWLAECVDAWRLMPRVLLGAYCAFVADVTYTLLDWYTSLPAVERGLESGGFAAAIFTVVTGLGTHFINTYLKSGRRWNE